MALRFLESFDHHVTADLPEKWTTVNAAGGDAGFTIASGGRHGNMGTHANDTQQGLSKTLDAQATWIVGVAFMKNNSAIDDDIVLFLRDNGTIQCDVYLGTTGLLSVRRSTTILATGTTPITSNTWYYIELKVTIGNTGSFELRINGITEVSSGSADTQNTANATANQVGIGEWTALNGTTTRFDDFYACDGTGGVNDDFLGDIRVETIFPNGNGNSSQFDGSDGNSTDNYLLVDETSPDDDTTYVESPDVSDKDTYAMTNLVTTAGTVYGLQVIPRVRKTEAGSRTMVTVARHSGSETDGPAASVTDGYIYRPDIRETKPGGGSWSISDVNGAEFGIKVDS